MGSLAGSSWRVLGFRGQNLHGLKDDEDRKGLTLGNSVCILQGFLKVEGSYLLGFL